MHEKSSQKVLNQNIQYQNRINLSRLKVGCEKVAKPKQKLALNFLKLRFRNNKHEVGQLILYTMKFYRHLLTLNDF